MATFNHHRLLNCGKGKKYRSISVFGLLLLFTLLHIFITKYGKNINSDEQVTNNVLETLPQSEVDILTVKPDLLPMNLTNIGKETLSSSRIDPTREEKICKLPPKLPKYLEDRKARAQEACTRLRNQLPLRWRRKNRGPSSGILTKLRWDPQHHLVYCHLPKVASTTWAWHLLRSGGLQDEEISNHRNIHILLQKHFPPPSIEDYDNGFLNDALAFVVSRHPFQRLISAYKNKIIEAEKRRQHYVDLRKIIMEKYHRTNETQIPPGIPTFRDFSEYVADSTEAWLGDMNHVPPPDPHWMPMTYMCSPCNLHYDVFSKLETMEEDTQFIAAQCKLGSIIQSSVALNPSDGEQMKEKEDVNHSKDESKHTSNLVGVHGKISSSLVYQGSKENENNEIPHLVKKSDSEYLSELSEHERNRLFDIYKFDFEIFYYDKEDDFR